jgi:hypothetical protein
MKKTGILIAFILFGYSVTFAQKATPRVDKRQNVQKERIREGVQNGELTRRETRRLAREQKHIRREERRVEADGITTPRERARLNRKQNRANREIMRKKNNARDRN